MTVARWLNLYPKTVDHGNMWDQTIIHWLLAPKPWQPEGASRGQLHQQGAIVIIPGRFHATESDVDRINILCRAEPWVVYVITSDEDSEFPVDLLNHPNRKIWVQTPKPGQHDQYGWLPVGWTPHTVRGPLMKSLDWAFMGQITHERRQELSDVLEGIERGAFLPTAGFTQGLDPADYIATLAQAKVAPCPSGPATVDTFRLYEALELGCIPIVEARTPKLLMPAYWDGLFGMGSIPFPMVESWTELPDLLDQLLVFWPVNASRIGAWWQWWKRNLHRRFWADVRAVRGS